MSEPNADQAESLDVVIVGAGIVGLAAAWKLVEAGRRVLLIDREGVAQGASFGNAGALAYSDILPIASMGMVGRVPGWLMDPLGPLAIPPGYLPQIAPWLLRFWRAGWPDRTKASIAAQSALMHLSEREMHGVVAAAGLQDRVRSDGSLELHESEREFKASLPGWQKRDEAGIAYRHVRGAELAEMQPGLSPRFVAGTFVPSWQVVSDPYDFAVALSDRLTARGAVIRIAAATAVRPVDGGVAIDLQGGETLRARQAVIAAGAWSKALSQPLGDKIPLETERGYNTTLPADAFDVRLQLIFVAHGFVITPLSSGLRVGGAVELGGLKRPPNYKRADAMLEKATRFLPGLKREGGRQWMGFRPSLPDTLPAIGVSRASPNIVYAFGHGHLGLTQSAGTGRLVADLVCGHEPAIDMRPFRPDRF
ncbi:NAD(P)/FAD-dependent oxidoreductase [Consotaella aegiceratis]|uniref:NAD(P)/FAD-dependent oxidoreductase n=1 Tax=Consotaella aegiceratis TaxID=3097961 RepID=UPI002F42D2A1